MLYPNVTAAYKTYSLQVSYFLWKSKTGMNYLDKAVKHIINITWESAALPCVCMIIAAGVYSGRKVGFKSGRMLSTHADLEL